MANSFYHNLLSPKIRFEKIKSLSSIKQLKDEEGFTLVELIVVVMMIGILSSIAIPQFMTAADKANKKRQLVLFLLWLKQLLHIKLNTGFYQ